MLERRPSPRIAALLAPALLAHAALAQGGIGTAVPQTNVLVILADDVGVDKIAAYGLAPSYPPTPTVSSLASQGVLFRNAYSAPVCSPSRACALTGRPAFLHGIGRAIDHFQDPAGLPQSEITLPELLDMANTGYATSAVGKWHLGVFAQFDALDPLLQGFDHTLCTRGNLSDDASPPAYYNWIKFVDGVQVVPNITHYATSEEIDDAIARMGAMPQPWFLWLAVHAPHTPFHNPPQSLHTYAVPTPPSSAPDIAYGAALQALDTEIGRMLPFVPPNTTIVFLGDNGTPEDAVLPPFDPARAKQTLYEGGIHVPMIVTGPLVQQPGTQSNALVHVTDLFASVAHIAGVTRLKTLLPPGRRIDSISWVPYLSNPALPSLRRYVYAEKFKKFQSGHVAGLWQRTIRDGRWKLISGGGVDEFYDMQGQVIEGPDLLLGTLTPQQQIEYARLKQALEEYVEGVQTDPSWDPY